mgnify:CR=1 FL=1
MVKNNALPALIPHWTVALQRGSFYLFPGCCLLCGTLSNRPLDLCRECEADLPFNHSACQRCALPLQTLPVSSSVFGFQCGKCLASPPDYTHCIAPLRYEFPVDTLINSFKHRGQFSRGSILAELLLRNIKAQEALPDLIAPVPLHWRRQFVRGFNQAYWLARYIGTRLSIPVDSRLLSRHKHTASQQGLSRKQRLNNLKDAFRLNHDIEGKNIALIDDVVTTGSTMSELSRLLRKAGAHHVEIWCLARTPLDK